MDFLFEDDDFKLFEDIIDEDIDSDYPFAKFEDIDDNQLNEEEAFDITEKILRLSDDLSEEIIVRNIEEQLSGTFDIYNTRVNYLTLFREKYNNLHKDDVFYDKESANTIVERVLSLVADSLKDKYGIDIEEPEAYTSINHYLFNMETLYEMFVVRNFENILSYVSAELNKNATLYYEVYQPLYKEERHYEDVFTSKMREKFKDSKNIIIIHFLQQIIDDILDDAKSAYSFFLNVTTQDLYEEFNSKFSNILIDYGTVFKFEDDYESIKTYLSLVTDSYELRNELKNSILLSFMESLEELE